MVTTKYVVLYGKQGVSKEFRSLNAAKIFGVKKAKQLGKPVEIDKLVIYGRDHWGQSMQGFVTPKGDYVYKMNRKSNSIIKKLYPRIFGKKRRKKS